MKARAGPAEVDNAVAKRWLNETSEKKPWRPELWALFAHLLLKEATSPLRILELGAGPGLLAKRVLRDVPVSEYVLFDFSEPMIAMAKDTLGEREDVSFYRGNFKEPNWPRHVPGLFDVLISMQAVYEIRHKRHVPWLYAQAATLLRPEAVLIICDAEPTPEQSEEQRQLASTRREQEHAMLWAGFEQVVCTALNTNTTSSLRERSDLRIARSCPCRSPNAFVGFTLCHPRKRFWSAEPMARGKTTFARQYLPLLYPGIGFLNADEIQRKSAAGLSSVAAGKELLRRLRVFRSQAR